MHIISTGMFTNNNIFCVFTGNITILTANPREPWMKISGLMRASHSSRSAVVLINGSPLDWLCNVESMNGIVVVVNIWRVVYVVLVVGGVDGGDISGTVENNNTLQHHVNTKLMQVLPFVIFFYHMCDKKKEKR